MPYYDVANLVTVTKTNIIDEMPCGYGTLRTTGVRIRHQVSCKPAQWSPQLQNLTILIVKSRSILNAPPSLQVLSEHVRMLLHSLRAFCKAPGGARSIWKYLEALGRASGVSERFAHGFRTEIHFADAVEW